MSAKFGGSSQEAVPAPVQALTPAPLEEEPFCSSAVFPRPLQTQSLQDTLLGLPSFSYDEPPYDDRQHHNDDRQHHNGDLLASVLSLTRPSRLRRSALRRLSAASQWYPPCCKCDVDQASATGVDDTAGVDDTTATTRGSGRAATATHGNGRARTKTKRPPRPTASLTRSKPTACARKPTACASHTAN